MAALDRELLLQAEGVQAHRPARRQNRSEFCRHDLPRRRRHQLTMNPNRPYIVCLEDGKRFKSLKRHLRTVYDMTPEQYRAKWGLARDYPMVAPNYAAARSELAKSMGLGARRRKTPEPEPVQPAAPAKGRRKKAA